MFVEFFDWFCNSLSSVFELMKKFVLFEGFTYYNFCVALLAVPIIIKLLYFIMGIEDEEAYFTEYTSEYESAYDVEPRYKLDKGPYKHTFLWNNNGYKPRHRASYRDEYIPKHEPKGRHGK